MDELKAFMKTLPFYLPLCAAFCVMSSNLTWAAVSQVALETLAPVEMQSPLLPKEKAANLKKFLLSTKGTYGWNPVKGTIRYDFFPDGRLHIQGPDGEATMWQGKWSLKGDQLTLVNIDEKTTKTVTAKMDGDELLLDDVCYRRYKP